jgi:hypothetical protein
MRSFTLAEPRLRAALCLTAIIAALYAVSIRADPAADSKPAKTKPEKTEKKEQAKPKQLTGAELYAIHCNRCHPERYAPERTEAQWKTILTHMRVRANLPAEQARTILKFLQEDSGK